MAGNRVPAAPQDQGIDSGTLSRHASPQPGPVGQRRRRDSRTSRARWPSSGPKRPTSATASSRTARCGAIISRKRRSLAQTIRNEVSAGRLTFKEGAEEANKVRNALLDASRLKSSDLGRAIAEAAKGSGLTLAELEAYYAQKLLKRGFDSLSQAEKNRVWLEIVEAVRPAAPLLQSEGGPAGQGRSRIRRLFGRLRRL